MVSWWLEGVVRFDWRRRFVGLVGDAIVWALIGLRCVRAFGTLGRQDAFPPERPSLGHGAGRGPGREGILPSHAPQARHTTGVRFERDGRVMEIVGWR